ncbi:DUF881 domain-containing protein [Nocardioides marmotae]|uniref:DUF881 domain-containing protein n=1 Tax=Nocardioides marmotae TaxID=2663857 RepID=A0A6I3J5C1_9ACTN|nr:DUF881 domain-containing protein [Nocardioides marmotae]MCR6030770.1 DUF881 domain-containing protein [Gordonia jinghuaiqii]MBC9733965.1 DUF881 domain-containing protein [Nocardioides marmotae]MTB85068.1 DUF881 domain-containing protein [Nocardioides marmotae]MTB94404.1 DUF881 domain-containing protein [Nocardioides marmotae]QKE01571.1 DUF881 domain-containing protein [Nocardioides marmotae]
MPESAPPDRPTPDRSTPDQPLPERVRLPLLTLITQQSLEEDYLHAAERRALAAREAGAPAPGSGAGSGSGTPGVPVRSRPHRMAAVVVALFGVLVTTAFVQTSRNEDVDAASRATLVRRVTDERERVADLQEQIVDLRERNAQLEGELTQARSTYEGVLTRLRRVQTRTGFVAVSGPGVVITLDDGPPEIVDSDVRDQDLRIAVNGLWRLGAEAIAINGQRLTALSAIRTSGMVVRVNKVNLSPPYRIEAIGDIDVLQSRFLESPEGGRLLLLESSYGIPFDMRNEDSLELPAARLRELRSVEPLEDNDPRPPEEAS